MDDREVLAKQYADDANLRARQHLWEISRSEPELDFNRWSVELTGAGPGDLVLDAGCGNGRPLALLRALGSTAVGLDQSLGMVAMAGGQALAGDVQRLPFPDDTFDAAVALMMLYHVPDQARAARELRRVVRPGGVVVATTASASNQAELRALVEGAVGGGWTWLRPSSASFHLEGGADVLGTAFDSVERVDAPERRIHVTDSDAMAAYVASSADHFAASLPAGRTWEGVVASVREATERAIAAEGALVLTARLGALVCR
jgi:SAM-dependent methyltransferase